MRRFLRVLSYVVMAAAVVLGLGLGVAGALLTRNFGPPVILAGAFYALAGLVVGGVLYMLTSIDQRLEQLKGDV